MRRSRNLRGSLSGSRPSGRLVLLLCGLAVLLSVPRADAAAVGCKFFDTRFPTISELRASNAGCTSARGVADAIKDGWQESEKFPKRVDAVDRTWRCTYRTRQGETNPYLKAICTSGRRTVGMVLGS